MPDFVGHFFLNLAFDMLVSSKEAYMNDLLKNAKLENLITLVLGSYIFFIPWVFMDGFKFDRFNVIQWNFVLLGTAVVYASVSSFKRLQAWKEWVNLLSGVWLFISPFLLFYFDRRDLLWNSIIVAILIVGASTFAIPIADKFEELKSKRIRKDQMRRLRH